MALDVLAAFRRLLFRLIVAVAEKALIAGKTTKVKSIAAKLSRGILIRLVYCESPLGCKINSRRRGSAFLARAYEAEGIARQRLSRAKREGWTRQIQSAKALAKREDALVATPVEAAAMTMRQRGERHLERMAGVSERGVDHIETTDGPGILRSIDQIEKLDKVARRTFQLNDSQATGQITLNVLNVQGDIIQG